MCISPYYSLYALLMHFISVPVAAQTQLACMHACMQGLHACVACMHALLHACMRTLHACMHALLHAGFACMRCCMQSW